MKRPRVRSLGSLYRLSEEERGRRVGVPSEEGQRGTQNRSHHTHNFSLNSNVHDGTDKRAGTYEEGHYRSTE